MVKSKNSHNLKIDNAKDKDTVEGKTSGGIFCIGNFAPIESRNAPRGCAEQHVENCHFVTCVLLCDRIIPNWNKNTKNINIIPK